MVKFFRLAADVDVTKLNLEAKFGQDFDFKFSGDADVFFRF